MDVRELRIGNWFINHEAEPETTIYWQVESIERASNSPNQKHLGVRFRSGSCWANASIIDPIPLTEEWLIKFGFKKVNHIHDGKIWIHTLIKLTWYPNGMIDLRGSVGWSKIEYVHQLQNLYFALTGEELQLKDNA